MFSKTVFSAPVVLCEDTPRGGKQGVGCREVGEEPEPRSSALGMRASLEGSRGDWKELEALRSRPSPTASEMHNL